MSTWTQRIAHIEQPPAIDPTTGVATGDWAHLAYQEGCPLLPARFPVKVRDVPPSRDQRLGIGAVSVASRRTIVRMRWRDDVNSAMRITLLGETPRVMQIIGGPAEVGGRKVELELMCEDYSS